jgi:alanine racemase
LRADFPDSAEAIDVVATRRQMQHYGWRGVWFPPAAPHSSYNRAMQTSDTRPTSLEVDLDRLKQNLVNIRDHVKPAKVMAVLKANAYGHGVDGVAPYLEPHADYIGVAIVEEGVHLRRLGIRKPILVMGGILPEQVSLCVEHELAFAVGSHELLEAAQRIAQASGTIVRIHLKIDTGMERMGIHDYEAEPFLERSLECANLDPEGIFTHFANADAADLNHARVQVQRFTQVMSFYDRRGIAPPRLRHMANSGAILQLPESHMDMVRPGIMLYGVYPGPDTKRTIEVRPALTWRSRVVNSKITQPGRPVSYGSTWQPERPTRVLTVPCGYADGYFRRMSNQAQVIIRGCKYPEIGRICMDQFMVAVGGDEVQLGEQVILLGESESGAQISAEDLATWAGTSEYEVLTNISARVPRVFKSPEGQTLVDSEP